MTVTAPPAAAASRTAPTSNGGPQPIHPPRTPALLHVLPTLLGALAVLGGATALTPLIAGTSWLLPLAEVVAVIWLVGIGVRLTALPAWGVGFVQLAALAVTITSLFTSTGVGGVIPGPAAVGDLGSMLHGAWDQIMVTVPPAPPTAELELFVAAMIGTVALVADLWIAGARAPALVALPLLALYSVPASIASDMLPWYAFVLPAVCYLALLATAHTSQHHVPLRGRAAVAVGTSGLLIGILAVGGALAADRVSSIGTDGRIPHPGQSGGSVGLSPWALLRGDLTNDSPVDVLRVSGSDQPAYLRTFALDEWTPNKGFGLGDVTADARLTDGTLPGTSAGGSAGAASGDQGAVTADITAQHYRDKYLPVYLDSTTVSGLGAEWDYDRDLQTVFRSNAVTPEPYSVTAAVNPIPAQQLRADTVQPGGPLTDTGALPPEIVSLAQSITANATSPFDQAQALLTYFTDPANGFTYSLKTPLGNSDSALVDFLTTKQGYCEQYAATMAIMVRSLGIPTRVGIGFTQGARQSDGSYEVTSTNAHAWVEVKFDHAGWVIFDPTPPVDGQGGLQGFVADAGSKGDDGATNGTSSATTSPSTTAPSRSAPLDNGLQAPNANLTPGNSDSAIDSGLGSQLSAILLTLVGLVVVGLLLAAPSLLRAIRRRRRLQQVANGLKGAGTAAWREIVDTLTDHRLDVPAAETARATANRFATTARLSARGRDDLRVVITAAEQEWYGDNSAATAKLATGTDLTAGVRTVITAVERDSRRSLFDRIWPRSLRRSRR